MYIKPNSRINDSFDYDRVGIEVVGGGANYNRFIIFQVKPNSPAAEADIKPDDELVEINFQPVKTWNWVILTRYLAIQNQKHHVESN